MYRGVTDTTQRLPNRSYQRLPGLPDGPHRVRRDWLPLASIKQRHAQNSSGALYLF